MQQDIEIFIEGIVNQRRRIRSNIPQASFRTWHAQTLCVLQCIPGIDPLQNRFAQIENSISGLPAKVQEARSVLDAVIYLIGLPIFVRSMISSQRASPGYGVYFAPQMTQVQNITQPITLNLQTLLDRIDAYEGLSTENKEEAKSLLGELWQGVVSRTIDVALIADIMARLAPLGIEVHRILQGL